MSDQNPAYVEIPPTEQIPANVEFAPTEVLPQETVANTIPQHIFVASTTIPQASRVAGTIPQVSVASTIPQVSVASTTPQVSVATVMMPPSTSRASRTRRTLPPLRPRSSYVSPRRPRPLNANELVQLDAYPDRREAELLFRSEANQQQQYHEYYRQVYTERRQQMASRQEDQSRDSSDQLVPDIDHLRAQVQRPPSLSSAYHETEYLGLQYGDDDEDEVVPF